MPANGYLYSHEEVLPSVRGLCCRRISKAKLLALILLVSVILLFLALVSPNYEFHQKINPNPKRRILPKVTDYLVRESGVYNNVGEDRELQQDHNNNIPKQNRRDFRQRLPQCLIIGTKKAGTGAMVQFLKLHPNVVVGDKELNFFDYENNFNQGFDYYRKLMPPSYEGQITMEKTSNYFHNKDTEWRVHSMNSSIKLLLLVREPIARTVSDYLQRKLKDKITKENTPPFEELILRRKNGRINEGYPGIRPSFYYKHMVRWLKYFPLSQFRIVDGDNLVQNPFEEVYQVEKFLGIPHLITKDRFVFSDQKGFYCMSVDGYNGTRQEQCLSRGKGRKHPDIDEGVMEMLTDLFRPLNEQFFRLIGRRFNWNV